MMKETSYELLKDEQKKQLGENNRKQDASLQLLPASSAKVIDAGVAINLVMVPIGLEDAMEIALETKVAKARDKKELATIAK
ncbi:hypothetical protein Tco_0916756 [Tanacetum coccineum]